MAAAKATLAPIIARLMLFIPASTAVRGVIRSAKNVSQGQSSPVIVNHLLRAKGLQLLTRRSEAKAHASHALPRAEFRRPRRPPSLVQTFEMKT
jgi:hypothetical protein